MPYQKLRAPKLLQRSSRMQNPSPESNIQRGSGASSGTEDNREKAKPVRINYIVKDLPLY